MAGKLTGPRILVALDYSEPQAALTLVDRLDPSQCRLKVGFELFVSAGPQIVEALQRRGFDCFLDLKFHDIPNTVAKAVAAAADLGVWMVNVHASGGSRMIAAAKDAIAAKSHQPILIAVTVLTSMTADDLAESGCQRSLDDQVLELARLTQSAGADGVVCSAREAGILRSSLGQEFVLVTPGVRPVGADQGDQRRVMAPREAIEAGSSYLVIGRPITASDDPLAALNEINFSLQNS